MIINLTQHPATAEQVAVGVVDLPAGERATLIDLLTVDALPSAAEISDRCADIAMLAAMSSEQHPEAAMIGGAPWMMARLEGALADQGIKAIYAFSVRKSAEQTMTDGTVRKVNIFQHAGFVEADNL